MTSAPSSDAEFGLDAHGLTVRFGGLTALEGVDLRLRRDEVLGLLGPNGAGKTTLVNALSGFQRATAGSVTLEGIALDGATPEDRARKGLARTFQAVRLFADLTVLANVEVGAFGRGAGKIEARRTAHELLEWLGLADKAAKRGAELPYSDERRVGIARALALRPRYLLLDEPAAGMNDSEAEALLEQIVAIPRHFGCGVMLIEHNVRLVMAAATRLQVLEFGRTLAEGDPATVRNDRRVIEAYLGDEF